MAGVLLGGIGANQIIGACAVATLLVLVYTQTSKWVRDRRSDQAVIAGKDKTALEKIATDQAETKVLVGRLVDVVLDRLPSLWEPKGHKGLVTVVEEHSDTLNRLLPNGGNTNDTGDLIFKLAKDRGLTEEPE